MTEEEKKELVQDVVNQIKTDSQSVDELENSKEALNWIQRKQIRQHQQRMQRPK